MKKLSLSGQLLVLFSCILFLTSISFSIITLTSVNSIAESELYSRLSTDSSIMDAMFMDSGNPNPQGGPKDTNFQDIKVGYYVYRDGTSIAESALEGVTFSTENVTELINEMQERFGDNPGVGHIQGRTRVDDTDLYYVCQLKGDYSNFTLIFSDGSFVSSFVKNISLNLIMVFLIMIVISILLISWWSNSYLKRVRKLQFHIEGLPKKKYEDSYIDDHEDEIGQLSQSVELMRKEINQNEHTKQEMLQNLSHDFKTPIAVIKSYAEAIQDGVETTDALNLIIAQADLLNEKVIKMLQYNSIEYLDRSKPFEDINMREIVENAVLKHKHQGHINFNLDVEDNITFKGYAENWDIVVSNIIENALRYAETEIKIVLREGRLRIYNDGEHIDEQFLNNVFKPYEKGSKGQFGLGMSIVEKTCIFFNYKLSVKNEDPKGVSFIIESSERVENNNQ